MGLESTIFPSEQRHVTIRVGDGVFVRGGTPAIVRDRKPSGQLELETEMADVQREMRHGFVSGMEPKVREEFNGILDEVKGGTEDPKERFEALRSRLLEVEQDPSRYQLARYIRAELVHLMNTFGIKPKEYSAYAVRGG